MRLSSSPRNEGLRCCTLTQPASINGKPNSHLNINNQPTLKKWELRHLLHPIDNKNNSSQQPFHFTPARPANLGKKWMEYQGVYNWDGLLDPLDDNLRSEILRYGQFVEAAYRAFEFDPSSPSYATCRFPKNSLFHRSCLPITGYRITKNLKATSGVNLPAWIENTPSWIRTRSSWIGFVAVSQSRPEIERLGRRDIVIAFRGTATCLEWLENLRATLTHLPDSGSGLGSDQPMVESGFLSLYSSGTADCPSLQQMVREEISTLLQSYGDEPLSLTVTGHSLGAALAILAAYDIKKTFKRAPLATVISFGGPRVGNRSFRQDLEKQGTKILRIVNSDDVITKVPGFVLQEEKDQGRQEHRRVGNGGGMPSWVQRWVEETQWVYSEVGKELKLSSRDCPHLSGINVAMSHELKTYLHLVDGFVSSKCPFRATARKMLANNSGLDTVFRKINQALT